MPASTEQFPFDPYISSIHPVSISVDVSIGSQRIPGELRSYMVFPKVRNLWAEGRPLGWLARKLEPEEL